MDAPVFPARPDAKPATLALSRAAICRAINAAAAPVQCGTRRQARAGRREMLHGARWPARSARPAAVIGSRDHLFALRGSGAHGDPAEPRGGAQHRLYPEASGTSSEEHGDFLGHAAGDTGLRLSGRGSAVDATAGVADRNPAGIRKDRLAGGARFLSSLYGRRAFLADHRAPAGIGGTAG